MKRPWSGQVEATMDSAIMEFDPDNPLCPGVTRPNGQVINTKNILLIYNKELKVANLSFWKTQD